MPSHPWNLRLRGLRWQAYAAATAAAYAKELLGIIPASQATSTPAATTIMKTHQVIFLSSKLMLPLRGISFEIDIFLLASVVVFTFSGVVVVSCCGSLSERNCT